MDASQKPNLNIPGPLKRAADSTFGRLVARNLKSAPRSGLNILMSLRNIIDRGLDRVFDSVGVLLRRSTNHTPKVRSSLRAKIATTIPEGRFKNAIKEGMNAAGLAFEQNRPKALTETGLFGHLEKWGHDRARAQHAIREGVSAARTAFEQSRPPAPPKRSGPDLFDHIEQWAYDRGQAQEADKAESARARQAKNDRKYEALRASLERPDIFDRAARILRERADRRAEELRQPMPYRPGFFDWLEAKVAPKASSQNTLGNG
jgi:hypothetical protein